MGKSSVAISFAALFVSACGLPLGDILDSQQAEVRASPANLRTCAESAVQGIDGISVQKQDEFSQQSEEMVISLGTSVPGITGQVRKRDDQTIVVSMFTLRFGGSPEFKTFSAPRLGALIKNIASRCGNG